MKKTKNIISTIIVLIIVIPLIFALFAHFRSESNFSVTYNGKTYTTDSNITLPSKGYAEFKVNNAKSYTVKFLPNVDDETEFSFRVLNGAVKTFGDNDYSSVIIDTETGFLITCISDNPVYGVLQLFYGTTEITLPILDDTYCYFVLQVESSSGDVIRLAIKQTVYITVEVFDFDITNIVF